MSITAARINAPPLGMDSVTSMVWLVPLSATELPLSAKDSVAVSSSRIVTVCSLTAPIVICPDVPSFRCVKSNRSVSSPSTSRSSLIVNDTDCVPVAAPAANVIVFGAPYE